MDLDGEPEDIFVEYKNLPENVHIYTSAVIGREKRYHNYSKVDTTDFLGYMKELVGL